MHGIGCGQNHAVWRDSSQQCIQGGEPRHAMRLGQGLRSLRRIGNGAQSAQRRLRNHVDVRATNHARTSDRDVQLGHA